MSAWRVCWTAPHWRDENRTMTLQTGTMSQAAAVAKVAEMQRKEPGINVWLEEEVVEEPPSAIPLYRATWRTDEGRIEHGPLASRADVFAKVASLKRYRDAWIEDADGNRVSYKVSED